mmetsp:Transcript_53272/g.133741  ORF Transcript_53272/g.133741 Transcript_53272/m.133741 type:complete len:203 (-) Transcript_53272:412-1020(-)
MTKTFPVEMSRASATAKFPTQKKTGLSCATLGPPTARLCWTPPPRRSSSNWCLQTRPASGTPSKRATNFRWAALASSCHACCWRGCRRPTLCCNRPWCTLPPARPRPSPRRLSLRSPRHPPRHHRPRHVTAAAAAKQPRSRVGASCLPRKGSTGPSCNMLPLSSWTPACSTLSPTMTLRKIRSRSCGRRESCCLGELQTPPH